MVDSRSIHGMIDNVEKVIARVPADAKLLEPWMKYSGEFVAEDISWRLCATR